MAHPARAPFRSRNRLSPIASSSQRRDISDVRMTACGEFPEAPSLGEFAGCALLQSGKNRIQFSKEALPAIGRTLVRRIIVLREARMLHANVCAAVRRSQGK